MKSSVVSWVRFLLNARLMRPLVAFVLEHEGPDLLTLNVSDGHPLDPLTEQLFAPFAGQNQETQDTSLNPSTRF